MPDAATKWAAHLGRMCLTTRASRTTKTPEPRGRASRDTPTNQASIAGAQPSLKLKVVVPSAALLQVRLNHRDRSPFPIVDFFTRDLNTFGLRSSPPAIARSRQSKTNGYQRSRRKKGRPSVGKHAVPERGKSSLERRGGETRASPRHVDTDGSSGVLRK